MRNHDSQSNTLTNTTAAEHPYRLGHSCEAWLSACVRLSPVGDDCGRALLPAVGELFGLALSRKSREGMSCKMRLAGKTKSQGQSQNTVVRTCRRQSKAIDEARMRDTWPTRY